MPKSCILILIVYLANFIFIINVPIKYYNNAYYAKVGGISTTEMNYLEVDFLFGLGFHLNVTPNTFHTYCSYLQREMILMQPQINIAEESILYNENSLKLHLCFNER
ncbi:hypothetical protein ACJIZ3_010676 [Penstemon smallii]|uniref:Uncharacterized protein n=1 Tax=Penstemon smallii TaxID=265156 RepID=A0ABD3UGZ0_9LAMI